MKNIKINNPNRRDDLMPQTIEQLIQKYQLNSLWKHIQEIVEEVIEQNSGYVIKKDGVMYIADNNNIKKAEKVLRLGKNGALEYSESGINGEYTTIISINGIINADFIRTGSLSADRIKGGTLILGGENDINGEFKVLDAEGKVLVFINKEGIKLEDGTKLIGNSGVLSQFQFGQYEWKRVGYETNQEISQNNYSFIDIPISIPENFIVTQAYVTLKHAPIKWVDHSLTIWGYCRNIKLYKNIDTDVYYKTQEIFPSENYARPNIFNNEISNAFGSDGFTASVPSDTTQEVEICRSANISTQLKTGKDVTLQIRSGNSVPEFNLDLDNGAYKEQQRNCLEQSGILKAYVSIIGYFK